MVSLAVMVESTRSLMMNPPEFSIARVVETVTSYYFLLLHLYLLRV